MLTIGTLVLGHSLGATSKDGLWERGGNKPANPDMSRLPGKPYSGAAWPLYRITPGTKIAGAKKKKKVMRHLHCGNVTPNRHLHSFFFSLVLSKHLCLSDQQTLCWRAAVAFSDQTRQHRFVKLSNLAANDVALVRELNPRSWPFHCPLLECFLVHAWICSCLILK